MSLSIAHLGPPGNYSEQATLIYTNSLRGTLGETATLCPYPSIAQSLKAVNEKQTQLAVVPAENSIEGSVTMTMDTMWQLDGLNICQALVMPIVHMLISCASNLDKIQTVYSHPQALAQCQKWLETHLPNAQLIPTNSNSTALQYLPTEVDAAAICSQRAAELYNLPILASAINDTPDNCTRFWVISQTDHPINQQLSSLTPTHTSLAFSFPANVPGALVKPLQIFAEMGINLSRIESRPTKRSLGEYVFFIDLEADANQPQVQTAISQLRSLVEKLKLFGSYDVIKITADSVI
ncbi:prephenate dehydratase [Calothrix sp. NIES-3974]|uniref:prephenate dehydratase n=1 Tax=Calothrix sp. NIES-3974 TaxID=2005462 RepID=UPI000B5E35FB|nr:prephenate dehydratase [Calothrix sp. NIES-3974]BAZ06753.1 prephenate dehydratase [Calothrix sp. NIES-3974]